MSMHICIKDIITNDRNIFDPKLINNLQYKIYLLQLEPFTYMLFATYLYTSKQYILTIKPKMLKELKRGGGHLQNSVSYMKFVNLRKKCLMGENDADGKYTYCGKIPSI